MAASAHWRGCYFIGDRLAPKRRFPGFLVQSLAFFALALGALGRIVYLMI